jgi:hypothetical protein
MDQETAENRDRPPEAESPAGAAALNADWLRDFYKECGREVTLAYTTLNQMKNWAITVQAAVVAAFVSFARSLAASSVEQVAMPLLMGGVLAYVFTLRFFVRAILCYINLRRWNRLQGDILECKLQPRRSTTLTSAGLEARLVSDIDDYYYRWLSPIGRAEQVASNLKLGFGILMVLPPLLVTYSLLFVWDDSLADGLAVFAVGATLIEAEDFFTSSFFDTPAVANARKQSHHDSPTHSGDANYIWRWVALGLVTAAVSMWPWIAALLTGVGPLPSPK